MKQRILSIPPHFSLILSLMLLTFYITDRYNTAMAFINHDMTKDLLIALVICNLYSAVRLIFLGGRLCRILRPIAGAVWGICSIAVGVVLGIDRLYPARILFTQENVKTLLLLLAAISIVSAVLLIVCQRKRAKERFENEIQENESVTV